MRISAATCPICDEPLWLEVPDGSPIADEPLLSQQCEAIAEEHLRSHPVPVQARFWLRQFLEDIQSGERAAAVKKIYLELRAMWGEQDTRASYQIDEVLGSLAMYRLWLDVDRCTRADCRHLDATSHAADTHGDRSHTAFMQVLGRTRPPPYWSGSDKEWRALLTAVTRQCRCRFVTQPSMCPAHRLLEDPVSVNRLLFARRIAERLDREELASPR